MWNNQHLNFGQPYSMNWAMLAQQWAAHRTSEAEAIDSNSQQQPPGTQAWSAPDTAPSVNWQQLPPPPPPPAEEDSSWIQPQPPRSVMRPSNHHGMPGKPEPPDWQQSSYMSNPVPGWTDQQAPQLDQLNMQNTRMGHQTYYPQASASNSTSQNEMFWPVHDYNHTGDVHKTSSFMWPGQDVDYRHTIQPHFNSTGNSEMVAPPPIPPHLMHAFNEEMSNIARDNASESDSGAAKKRQLPAWLRDELEKMERKKAKQPSGKGDAVTDNNGMKCDAEGDVVMEDVVADVEDSKPASDNEAEISSIKKRSRFDSPDHGTDSDSDSNKLDGRHTEDKAPVIKAMKPIASLPELIADISEEEWEEEMIRNLTRVLTEVLLAVTNAEIFDVAEQVFNKAELRYEKELRPQSRDKTATKSTTLSGLFAYGGGSGSDSEGSDVSDKKGDSLTPEEDSDAELERLIRHKKQSFAKRRHERELKDENQSNASSPSHSPNSRSVNNSSVAKDEYKSPNVKASSPSVVNSSNPASPDLLRKIDSPTDKKNQNQPNDDDNVRKHRSSRHKHRGSKSSSVEGRSFRDHSRSSHSRSRSQSRYKESHARQKKSKRRHSRDRKRSRSRSPKRFSDVSKDRHRSPSPEKSKRHRNANSSSISPRRHKRRDDTSRSLSRSPKRSKKKHRRHRSRSGSSKVTPKKKNKDKRRSSKDDSSKKKHSRNSRSRSYSPKRKDPSSHKTSSSRKRSPERKKKK